MNYSATSSTTSLFSQQKAPNKNYQAAFGALSSSYGFGGGVPTLPQSQQPTTPHQPSQYTPASPNPTSSSSSKDYSAAFGSLAGSYGFSGGVPALPHRK